MNHLYAPREIIGEVLVQAASRDPRLIVLDADLGRSTRLTAFEKAYPERFIQLGVAEQNAVGFASGLIYAGYHPVFVTFTMFAIGLPWTQLRQAAYAGLPIKILGTHPGYDIGPDGGTHQMFEDIALARVIPELVVLSPCDIPETKAAILAALDVNSIVYVRIGRHPVRNLHTNVTDFPIGKAEILYEAGHDCVLIADGSMASETVDAAMLLEASGLSCTVINIRTLKPIDDKLLRSFARKSRLLVTVENHSIYGGLGGAVAEVISEAGGRLFRLGSPDKFGESATTEELRHLFCLDATGIADQVRAKLAELS